MNSILYHCIALFKCFVWSSIRLSYCDCCKLANLIKTFVDNCHSVYDVCHMQHTHLFTEIAAVKGNWTHVLEMSIGQLLQRTKSTIDHSSWSDHTIQILLVIALTHYALLYLFCLCNTIIVLVILCWIFGFACKVLPMIEWACYKRSLFVPWLWGFHLNSIWPIWFWSITITATHN